jgi:UDP-N-acetylmuramate dehydrogenase
LTPKASVDALQRAAEILGPLARRGEPIGNRTTYRVGGAAALFVEVEREDDLSRISEAIRTSGIELLVLGNGSNMLVAQAGFDGLVVTLGRSFDFVEIEEDCVRVGAATPMPVLARRVAAQGRESLVWTVGIPGTVGGAVAMNAGGHGADTARDLLSATVVDLASGTTAVKDAHSLSFSYRHADLAASELVLEATFRAPEGDVEKAREAIEEIVRWRRDHQPGGRNAGSVFQNPPDDSAGRILDSLGLKGLRVGGAEISSKHANFIQLDADGSSDDVDRLIELARAIVEERTGIRLEPEVRRIGFDR